jgi:RNA polymerase sigma-70 factor (ECF subfamily)
VTAPAAAGPRAQFLARVGELRPELHRYCARLTGSVFDGEDIVQDTLARGLAAVDQLDHLPALRPWLFRIAHNRAIDVVRERARRTGEPLAADEPIADASPGSELLRAEAVHLAVSRFIALPPAQRSAVILKDVLELSLDEIAGVLDMSLDAVKGALARGRARLVTLQAAAQTSAPPPPSPAIARYAALFNAHDWDALRALLADDVQLQQSDRPRRRGAAEVGQFFTYYASYAASCTWRVVPAWVEGREILAVFEPPDQPQPSYITELTWRDGKLSFIRDFRYTRYVASDAEILVAGAEWT